MYEILNNPRDRFWSKTYKKSWKIFFLLFIYFLDALLYNFPKFFYIFIIEKGLILLIESINLTNFFIWGFPEMTHFRCFIQYICTYQ